MCLRLTYEEALQWKQHAAQLVLDAKKKSKAIPCDPLFGSNPRLSSLVSEIDSIKKRHGLLIERALIYAINKVPDWTALKEQIAIASGKAHLDCLAFNSRTGALYVFECKRGHGSFDGDKISAIDERLNRIAASVGAHALSKGWNVLSTGIFILSFYGASWKSAFPIHTAKSIGRLFEPCVGRFMSEFMSYLEFSTAGAYGSELRDAEFSSVTCDSIFDKIDADSTRPWPDLVFTESGVRFLNADI